MHRALTRKGAMTLLVAVQKGNAGTSEAVTRAASCDWRLNSCDAREFVWLVLPIRSGDCLLL